MSNKIEITDIFGERVICSRDTWYGHIATGHPIMKNNVEAVVDTIQSPEAVFRSAETSDRKVYFKNSELSSYNMYTKVVTKSVGSQVNEIVSAWPQQKIGGNIGDELYKK